MILDFLSIMDTQEERKVDTYEKEDLFVDTCSITDSDKPYETAIACPQYNDAKLIIVELYDTKEEAQKGHNKWVKIMTAKKLPETIKDVSTATIAKFCDMYGTEFRLNKKVKKCKSCVIQCIRIDNCSVACKAFELREQK